MSKTANRVLSMVLAVFMLLSMMTVFAVADTVEAFADAYDGTVISKKALLVDATITAEDEVITRAWDGKEYTFEVGVNAFKTNAEVYAFIKAQLEAGEDDYYECPDIIVLALDNVNFLIDTASKVYSPAWNIAPMNEMGDMTKVGAQGNGVDWTENPAFAAKSINIIPIFDGDVDGTMAIYGFTFHNKVFTKGVSGWGAGVRSNPELKADIQIVNSVVATSQEIPWDAYYQDANEQDSLTIKNIYFKTVQARTFCDGAFPANVTIDGMYVDFDKTVKPTANKNVYFKTYSTKEAKFVIKNSNLRGTMAGYGSAANSYFVVAGYAYKGTENKGVVIENNTLAYKDGNGMGMVNYTDGVTNSPRPAMTSTAKGGITSYVVKDNYFDASLGGLPSLIYHNFPSASKVEFTGNKVVGFTGTTLFNTQNTYVATNNYVTDKTSDFLLSKPAGDPFYLDYDMTTLSTTAVDFNEAFETGLNINGVALSKEDTVVVVPSTSAYSVGSEKVAYLKLAGQTYKFVVDGVSVVEIDTGANLSTVTALTGKKNVVFASGNYGTITLLPTGANYYGANLGIDPIDKSGATAENNFDWALSKTWDESYDTEFGTVNVPATVTDTLLLDGITLTNVVYADKRGADVDSLDLTFRNIVLDTASTAGAIINLDAANRTGSNSAPAGSATNEDTSTFKNFYVKRTSSNQIFDEWNSPILTIDNMYWNANISGQKRNLLAMFKFGSAIEDKVLTVKNSNFRTATAATSYNLLRIDQGNGVDLVYTDNIFYVTAGSGAIQFPGASYNVNNVTISNNMFISAGSTVVSGTLTAKAGTTRVADGNRFIGYAANQVALGGLTLTNTFASADKDAAKKPDANLGVYSTAMGNNPYYLDYNKVYQNTGVEITDFALEGIDASVTDTTINIVVDGTPDKAFTVDNFATGNAYGKEVAKVLATDSAFNNTIDSYNLKNLKGAATLYIKVMYTDNEEMSNVYTVKVIDSNVSVFNEDLANGMEIGGYSLTAEDTAIWLSPEAQAEVVDGVAYLEFNGKLYKFVVDGEVVFANNAFASIDKENVLLFAGNYGNLTVNTAKTFIGTNAGINPNDDTDASASNGYDWKINTDWDKENASVFGKITIPAGISGDTLVIDGVVMGLYNDTDRLLTDGSLYTTVKNSMLESTATGNGFFTTNNKRSTNSTDEAAGLANDDSLKIIDSRFMTVKTNQLFHEVNVPIITMDGVYIDMKAAGKPRSIVAFFKWGIKIAHAEVNIYNSNFRNGTNGNVFLDLGARGGQFKDPATGAWPWTYEGGEPVLAVNVEDNIFYNAQGSNAVETFTIDYGTTGEFNFNRNTVIDTTGKAKLFGFTDDAGVGEEGNVLKGNVTVDNNNIIGFTQAKATFDTSYGEFTNTFFSPDLGCLEDASACTGTYHPAMGNNDYYINYAREYSDAGTRITGIAANIFDAVINAGEISLSVYDKSQVITADTFITSNATEAVVKTLATDAEFANVVESYDLATESTTIYLKVAYEDVDYAKVYAINVTVEHELADVEGKDKTCTEDGYTAHKVCANCDYKEGYEVIPASHELADVDAKDKTCTEDGYTAHKACANCDYKEDYELIPASHELADVEGKDKTCTEDGYTAHKACANCDYKEGYEVIAAGHELVDAEGKDKTCEEDGYTAHLVCSVCGHTEGKETIPAGHELADVEGKDKTCTEDGYTAHKACANCDYKEGYEVIPASHELVDVDAKDKTCTEDGYTAHKACANCDYKEGYEVIPAGHSFTDKASDVASPDGGFYIQCDNCDVVSDTLTTGKVYIRNEETGKVYASVEDAISGAAYGETVTLLDDVTVGNVLLEVGVTLDLNGHTLTANSFVSYNGSSIVDNGATVADTSNGDEKGETKAGKLYVNKNYVVISKDNSQLPVYDANEGCFMFIKNTLRDDYIYYDYANECYIVTPIIGDNNGVRRGMVKNVIGKGGAESSGVELKIRVSWATYDEYGVLQYSAKRDYVYTDEYLSRFVNSYGNKGNNYSTALSAIFKGDDLKQAEYVYVSTVLASSTGVEIESNVTTINSSLLG